MAVHSSLTGTNLHNCKGVDSAVNGQTVIFDGSGSQQPKHINPRGACYFNNIASPYSVTYPSTYTKIAPTTTVAGLGIEFTEGTNGRLTYVGVDTMDVLVTANISLSQAIGATRDIRAAIFQNGAIVAPSEVIQTMLTGNKRIFSLQTFLSLSTNGYVEVFVKNDGASGDVAIRSFYLSAVAMRG